MARGRPRRTRERSAFGLLQYWNIAGLCAVTVLAALMAPPEALADTADATATSTATATLPEVTVTARRVEESIQKVPVTVTAKTGEQLQQLAITNVQQLTYTAPSLTVASFFNVFDQSFSVRGLPGVTTYFSEAPCCMGPPATPFLDIQQVQVLNGPQGTLFGRSSAAGAILITPKHPDMNAFGGFGDITAGDYDRLQVNGAVNVPLIPDHLAVRAAAGVNYIQGYTRWIGGGGRYDGVNNQQVRLGAEFKAGGFDDYAVVDYFHVDQQATGEVLAGIDPNIPIYNEPAFIYPFIFGAPCAAAVKDGLAANVNTCIAQRTAYITNIPNVLNAEYGRVLAGGSAVRMTPAPINNDPTRLVEWDASLVNVAQYDFGELGPVRLSLKDIFSFEAITNDTGAPADGIGGVAEDAGSFNTAGAGSDNEIGHEATFKLGPPSHTYNNDLQVHFDADHGLLVGTFGLYYIWGSTPQDLQGTGNIYQIFGGVLNENLGYNSAQGFLQGAYNTETAVYTQETLDLSRFIHGLSLTGGYRFSWDRTRNSYYPTSLDEVTGIFSPNFAAPLNVSAVKSEGYNFTGAVQEQWTDKFMTYLTVARAYVPGGVNILVSNQGAAAQLPNYTPTFGPETVLSEELGAKLDFQVDGVAGRLDADVYNYDFSDITEGFTGLVGNVSIGYTENVAAANLKGFELQGTLIPTQQWEIQFGYNFNDAHYTKWTGEDPVNFAKPGDPICLPTSPAGFCFLNLTNNPFAQMPAHQGHVTLIWHQPIEDNRGDLTLAATLYAQSRVWYVAYAKRELQVLPSSTNGISQAGYTTLNLRADWHNIWGFGFDASFFMNNVTDQVYATGKTAQLLTLGFSVANYAPPRMFGFEVSKKF